MKCVVLCAVLAVSFAVIAAGPVVDDHQTPHVNSVCCLAKPLKKSIYNFNNLKYKNFETITVKHKFLFRIFN